MSERSRSKPSEDEERASSGAVEELERAAAEGVENQAKSSPDEEMVLDACELVWWSHGWVSGDCCVHAHTLSSVSPSCHPVTVRVYDVLSIHVHVALCMCCYDSTSLSNALQTQCQCSAGDLPPTPLSPPHVPNKSLCPLPAWI